MTLIEKTAAAKKAGLLTATLSEAVRNKALISMAASLRENSDLILEENTKDLDAAEKNNLGSALLKRLALSLSKLEEMAAGLESLATLRDPLGIRTIHRELDDGLLLQRLSVPIGLIGVIFESRPDALVQIAGLCVKSGNALILKGGSEASHSNRILHEVLYAAICTADEGFENSILLVETRAEIGELLALDQYIDLMIPRGSNQLVKYIMDNTQIPVMGHADGICHMYVDKVFDKAKSIKLIRDGKTQYAAVCNAIETLLVNRESTSILPELQETLPGVELRGCTETQKLITCEPARDEDWDTEYNELILSIKIVESLEEAIEHINTHGSHHTDVILTESKASAELFMSHVDSASVMWNASSRFADGFRYGFGAEVGISTGKIHARGPVGLEGLTIYKYRLVGDGHLVADYAEGRAMFTHKDL
ncbi:MAG: glutamate-5-semialdehyde dehydrogenase [Spirochaetales bacterium]|nr:glutamate-5-semialdehyde dehydrogenase [Spirochaetales bacterium]